MTTSRDLMITALDVAPDRPVEQGDLSLALAGAEVIDLLAAGAVTLDGERIVPGDRTAVADRLLEQAVASLPAGPPYESIEDWLWRRGLGLASVYLAAFEADGRLTRQRHGWMPFRTGEAVLVDTPERRLARDRWAANEPVLVALATAVGIREEEAGDAPGAADDASDTVLAAVNGALVELEGVRQRRAIEQAAFDNIWRGD